MLRRIALARAKYRCQICNANDRQLDVHHRTYERLGREQIEDLTVLCHDCHDRHHNFDDLVKKETEELRFALYLYENDHAFDYSGGGLCRRCAYNATKNFGTTDELFLACDTGCDLKMNCEDYRSESIPESSFRTCENCDNLARLKFRLSDWHCEDAFEEHFACSVECRDSLTLKDDTWHLNANHVLDAGQFSGMTLAALPDWYLQCIEESVPSNGSKIRRACLYEKWRRNQRPSTGRSNEAQEPHATKR